MHAGLPHLLPQWRARQCARAQTVDHGPAGHAALRGTHQGMGHIGAGAVVQPDVVQHIDLVARGIHVGQHLRTGMRAIAHELGPVAGQRYKAVDGRGIAEGRQPLIGNGGSCLRHGAGCGRKGAAPGLTELAHIEPSAARYTAQGHFPKQVVQQAAHIGQQHDDHEPGQPHIGPHVSAQQNAQAEAGNQQYMKSQQQPGHESVQQRWTLSSITGSGLSTSCPSWFS